MKWIEVGKGGSILSVGDILGLVAGAITTGSFLPQVLRVYRLKSAHEISLFFTILFLAGDLTWLGYGVYIRSFPIMLWNILGSGMALALLAGKLKYGGPAKNVANAGGSDLKS
jgi:MtN3 and saliva related transmembrane protein